MANAVLTKAKKEKNDEFYTKYEDIENELKYYKEYLNGKKVFFRQLRKSKIKKTDLHFLQKRRKRQICHL